MPIARKIPKPAGRFWLCSVIRTKYDNTINRHYPAWFPHGYYLTFSSLCHCAIYVIARTPQRHFPPLSFLCHCTIYVIARHFPLSVIARLDRAIHHFMSCFSDAPGRAGVWQQQRPLLSCLCHFLTFSPFCHCPAWPDNPLFSISFFGILRLCVRNI